jgi:hypothetical protein
VSLDARNTRGKIAGAGLVQELRASASPAAAVLTASDEALLRLAPQAPVESRQQGPARGHIAGTRPARPGRAGRPHHRHLEPGVHQLRETIRNRVERRSQARLSILFESFGFKNGIPGDADFVFDARSLPNPYWEPALRGLTGRDADVIRYLENQPGVAPLTGDITRFIESRIPEFRASNRRYLTVAIGCTGGQHRSVFLAERIAADFAARRRRLGAPLGPAGRRDLLALAKPGPAP